ncbi:MAG: molybdopterin dinucleotide binding domain-containing protein [Methanotrichaceae archaeon]|nr:molybdopterin dinucleotide binding domain-containing protein [Methanotrichaceae archaeon]
MEVEVSIVTFRDIFQYEAGKKGRYTPEYQDLSAQIILDKQDMAKLGVKDGARVLVENDVGKIIVAAKASDDDPHAGLAFMTNSPWSNHLVRDDVCETSIPGFKKIAAKVSPSGEEITKIGDLLERMKA